MSSLSLCFWIWNFQGVWGTKCKNHGNSRGVGGVTRSPLERKSQWGGGSNWEKNPPWGGGYGYFLEPHIFIFLQEQDNTVDLLEKGNKRLNEQLEDKADEIKNLNRNIFELDQDMGEKLKEIVQLESQLDDIRTQYWNLWNSYQNDREWWKQRAEKALG